MKILFKVWNILILVSNIISAIVIIAAMTKIGSDATELSGPARAIGGVAVAFAVIGLLPVVAVIFMAKAGLQENYDTCINIGKVVLLLDAICIFGASSLLNAFWQIGTMIVYLLLAAKLRRHW